ncbi:MAG: hypothetical protein NT015_19090 [Alphaproteobacteria bacterium]|nr:hypothetical protein [Alphaproteobacteria bacterium]
MRRSIPLGLILALCACAAAATNVAAQWDGRYEDRFENGLVSGETFESTNVLDVLRIDDQSALVEIGLEFYNGHECSFSEVFHVEGEALVYREQGTSDPAEQCTMTITRTSDAMVLHDENYGCAHGTCGARGGYDGISLPVASRRAFSEAERSIMQQQMESLSHNER